MTKPVWSKSNGSHRQPHSTAFSPDGKQIVSGSRDNTIKLWDALSGQETLTLKGHNRIVHSVAFNPNGTRIISGGGNHRLFSDEVVGLGVEFPNCRYRQGGFE